MSNDSIDPSQDVIIQSVVFGDGYKMEIMFHEQRDQVFQGDNLVVGRQIHDMIDVQSLGYEEEFDLIIDSINRIIEAAAIRRRNPVDKFSRDPRRRPLRIENDDE